MALAENRSDGNRIFFDIAKKLPVFLPATITLGIAPLLFVQVLYGQFFYTSSIIMAWPWFFVLVLLTLAYYGFYYVSFHSGKQPGRAGIVMLFSVILVCLIGFVYSNNLTLSLVPSRWGAKYFANPSGWHLNLSEPTLIPRFLHFFIAAVAVGGLLLVFVALANWNRDHEYARQLLQFGGRAFMYATMAQFLVGVWFLVSLPREMLMLFTGNNLLATALLLVGVFSASVAIFMMSYAVRKENIRVAAYLCAGSHRRRDPYHVRHARHPAGCVPEALLPSRKIRRSHAVVCVSAVSGALYRRCRPVVHDAEALWFVSQRKASEDTSEGWLL